MCASVGKGLVFILTSKTLQQLRVAIRETIHCHHLISKLGFPPIHKGSIYTPFISDRWALEHTLSCEGISKP